MMKNELSNTKRTDDRRSFMKSDLLTGGAATVGVGLLANGTSAHAQFGLGDGRLDAGDIAIIRFLAVAGLLESDLWIQYAELSGLTPNQLHLEVVPAPPMKSYQAAFLNLDGDGPQYISRNTLDEVSHATFLNAYLESKGAEPVNLDKFRTLQGSTATGSTGIGRLTDLMHLNVDTSWFVRYRSAINHDFGATFPQAININNRTAIPITNADFRRRPRRNEEGGKSGSAFP